MTAAERFDISDRSIGRYLKKAMIRGDELFLRHFKLATIDNEVIEGPKVSLQLIDELQAAKRVPTWYVSSDWLTQNFDPRDSTAESRPADEVTGNEDLASASRGDASTQDSKDEIIVILKSQITSLEADKQKLEQEKKEMREDARQTRELMNRMQQLMAHMQDRLLPERTASVLTDQSSPVAPVVVNVEDSQSEKGSIPVVQQKARKPAPRNSRRRSPVAAKKTVAPKVVPVAPSIWRRDLRELLPFRKK